MPVTVYQSTDASAPVLNGNAGSLCTVLDACLVNGYGVKAAAGWAIAFTAASKRIYRAPSGALRPYIRVDDTAPRAAPFNNANEARVMASEAATGIDVQTGKFPPTGNGVIMLKDNGAVVTSRPWIVIADDRTVYMWVQSGDFGMGWASMCFGEYFSLQAASDVWNGILIGNPVETIAATPIQVATNEKLPLLSALGATLTGHYVARAPDGFGPQATIYQVGKHGAGQHSQAVLAGLLAYPNRADNGLYLAQVHIHDAISNLAYIRGRLRGFWHCLHPAATLKHGDTWNGTGALAGKSFMAIGPTPGFDGMFVMETSNTWERN